MADGDSSLPRVQVEIETSSAFAERVDRQSQFSVLHEQPRVSSARNKLVPISAEVRALSEHTEA